MKIRRWFPCVIAALAVSATAALPAATSGRSRCDRYPPPQRERCQQAEERREGGGGGGGTTVAISGLAIAPSTFAPLPGAAVPAVPASAGGAVVSFNMTAAGTVVFRVYQRKPGRKVRGRCVPPNANNRTRPRCTRHVLKGSFTVSAAAGANRFRFTGRVGTRVLKPGNYRLDGQASRTSKASARFKISR
jgi:hypothetical protein